MRIAAVAFLALALTLGAAAARGHGGRVDFATWGPLPNEALRCQRSIARAASACAQGSWELTRACRQGQGVGVACDPTRLTARIQSVRVAALNAVDVACSERQAQDIGYLGLFDLQADLIDFCRAWSTAATSAIYTPRILPGSEANACTSGFAEATSRLLSFVSRRRRHCMEAIAAKQVAAAQRDVFLARTAQQFARYTAGLATRLRADCPEQEFSALYGRPAAALLTGLAARADCLGAAVYIQDRILCADAVCGNAIVEPGEVCDDGNQSAGDRCSADCATATAP